MMNFHVKKKHENILQLTRTSYYSRDLFWVLCDYEKIFVLLVSLAYESFIKNEYCTIEPPSMIFLTDQGFQNTSFNIILL